MDISEELKKLKLIENECKKIASQKWEDRDCEDFTAEILCIVSPELFNKYFGLEGEY